MALIDQHRVVWSVPKGGAGVSTFYFRDSDGPHPQLLKDFFDTLKTQLPAAVTINYPTVGNVVDDATGNTVSTWSNASVGTTTGSGTGAYAGAAGAVINWHSGVYQAGREIRGKTFIVPLIGSAYDSDGTLLAGALTILKNAADLLHGGINPITIYSPTNHTSKPCASAVVKDEVFVLKSRKR
jgi:hypothetical protein